MPRASAAATTSQRLRITQRVHLSKPFSIRSLRFILATRAGSYLREGKLVAPATG
jgi:hypothetical protein